MNHSISRILTIIGIGAAKAIKRTIGLMRMWYAKLSYPTRSIAMFARLALTLLLLTGAAMARDNANIPAPPRNEAPAEQSDEEILRQAVAEAIGEGKTEEALRLLNEGAERFGWHPKRYRTDFSKQPPPH